MDQRDNHDIMNIVQVNWYQVKNNTENPWWMKENEFGEKIIKDKPMEDKYASVAR